MPVLYAQLLEPNPQAIVHWWLCDDGNISDSGTEILNELNDALSMVAEDATRLQVVALIPNREILYRQVDVPGRTVARMRQATPFAVEPFLAEDIDNVHIITGEIKRGERVSVGVINRTRLLLYLDALDACGIAARIVTTLSLCVAGQPQTYLLEADGSVTVCLPDQHATVGVESLDIALHSALASDSENRFICCIRSNANDALSTAINNIKQTDLHVEEMPYAEFLSGIGEPNRLMNLRQGDYAFVEARTSIEGMWHRTALGLAASVLIVSIAMFAQGLWADWQTAQLKEQTLDVFESVYGTRTVSGNPVFRMQERVGARIERGSEWLKVLDAITKADTDVEFTNLDFSERQNRLTITFKAADFAEFEDLRTQFEKLGLTIDVNVAEQQNDQVWARLTVSST
ncbi:MAG: hypothetical protein F4W90_03040 [Gammaproteobacteria bacterium]|nr:hypothetical protein [Gammaproteobacteria bacterium]